MRARYFIALAAWVVCGQSTLATQGTCQCGISVISGATGLTISSTGMRGPCGRPISMANVLSAHSQLSTSSPVSQSAELAAAAVAAPAVVDTTVGNNFFSPSPLTINVGDTVKWTWAGGSLHSVTSVTGSLESFDSGDLSTGTFSHTFSHAGTYVYYCDIHGFELPGGTAGGMFSTITVNAVPEPVAGLLVIGALPLLGRWVPFAGRRQKR